MRMSAAVPKSLSIVLALLALPSQLGAQDSKEWRIPTRVELRERIEDLSGSQVNAWIYPLKRDQLMPETCVDVTANVDTLPAEWWSDSELAFLQNHDLNQGAQVHLQKNWRLFLNDPTRLRLCVKPQDRKPVRLNPISRQTKGEREYRLPPGRKFTLEFETREVQADLLLPAASFPLANNPITLDEKKAPASGWLSEGVVNYHIRGDAFTQDAAQTRIVVMFLAKDTGEAIGVRPMVVAPRENKEGYWGQASLPRAEELESFRILSTQVWATALVTQGDRAYVRIDQVLVSHPRSALLFGSAVVLIAFVLVMLTKPMKAWTDSRLDAMKRMNIGSLEKLVRIPFYFAITPLGRYSISLAQITFWTVVVAFSFAYVAFSRGEFLEITGQMLSLLGISAGTAVLSRVVASNRATHIPEEYLREIRKDRIPRFSDLICIGDAPSVFKFQIVVFTLLVGLLVLRELLRTGNFPALEANLLVLMGMSGGTYLANELATETVWKEIGQWLEDIGKKKEKVEEIEKTMMPLEVEKSRLEQKSPLAKADRSRLLQIEPMLTAHQARKEALREQLRETEADLRSRLTALYQETSVSEAKQPQHT